MEYMKHTDGTGMEDACNMYRIHMEYVCNIGERVKNLHEHLWNMNGICMEYVKNVYGSCMESERNMNGWCMEI